MKRREDRRQRLRDSLRGSTNVNLISMMDILTVLLLFLLKSYSAGGEVMVPPPGITLPNSSAQKLPESSLVIAIDGDDILVGSEKIVSVGEALAGDRKTIEPLAASLSAALRQQDEISRRRGEAAATHRVVTIQGDRNIQFRVLERVMYTAHQAGFETVALAVIQNS